MRLVILICIFVCLTPIANAEHQGDWEPWEVENQELLELSPENPAIHLEFPQAFLQLFAIGVVKFYQIFISPQLMPSCNFIPSCSRYSVQAIQRCGPVKGSLMTLDRLQRCHYWIRRGWYSVADNGLLADPITDRAICIGASK